MEDYKPHEFANIFPLMNSKEFNELKRDIKENSQMDEIVVYNGQILDGRNRYNACKEIGIKPKIKEFDGDNPLQYVMSTNLKRRHLTDSQKAIVGRRYKVYYSKFAKERQGTRGDIKEPVPESQLAQARDKAGEVVGVSGRYIDIAEQVLKAKPEMEEEIMAGNIKLKQVYRDIKLEQQEKEIQKLKDIKGEYEVIVIDPPWQYNPDEKYDNEHFMGRVIAPYPTMTIPEIRSINLPAGENCVLWLWTTHRFIWDAIELMKNWGFEYKCILTWDKEKMGIGKWLRMQSEFCLIGIKGKPIWKLTNQRDIIREARTTHSTKPESFYKMVNEICVGRKLDYFARKPRKGWDVFGDEVN